MLAYASDPISAQTEPLAQLFKASGDPLRLDILRVLMTDSFSVQELCQIFAIRQPAMSHHLKVLSNAGLMSTRREGNTIFYARKCRRDQRLKTALDAIYSCIDSIELDPLLTARVEQIQVERAERSRQFFRDNAHRFREQQDLIAGFAEYGPAVLDLLDAVHVPRDRVMDLGCGQGDLLPDLAQRFTEVVALDCAPEMLQSAQSMAAEHQLHNIRFVLGDSQTLLANSERFPCIICNMVLHHVSSPTSLLLDIARLLPAGGSLIVTDLCHHDQNWVREACGDLWLGFEPEALSEWAQNAGLRNGREHYLALRNGFRVQLRHFTKPLV